MVVTCANTDCGKQFKRKPTEVRPGCCCSKACSYVVRKRVSTLRLTCAWCGKEFTRKKHMMTSARENACCSRACGSRNLRRRSGHKQPFVATIVKWREPEPVVVPVYDRQFLPDELPLKDW